MNRKITTFRYSFAATLPVMAGYIVLGIGFGVLLQDKGLGWPWAALMSLTIYAGSMQYVAVDLISAGASLVTMALMTVMVNIRHLFYGISMLQKYGAAGKEKPYLIFALTDETYSLVCSPELPEGVEERWYYIFVSALDQLWWITGSVLGAVLGSSFSFDSSGVDFAMTALFVVIFVEQWEKAKSHFPALAGAGITALCRVLFGSSGFLIPSMAGITAALPQQQCSRNAAVAARRGGPEKGAAQPGGRQRKRTRIEKTPRRRRLCRDPGETWPAGAQCMRQRFRKEEKFMPDTIHTLLLIAVSAVVTALIRFAPFLVFRKKTPKLVLVLAESLPYAIMGMLVVYCLKNVTLLTGNHGLPELLAVLLTALLHKWKHNTLLSIPAGTLFYMFLIQAVF